MPALFIGRFQPFHLGHLDAINQIREDEVIIGVGSAQYQRTNNNPYSFEERNMMIEKALETIEKKITIIPIPDIHDSAQWVTHVQNLVPYFDVVYTGNPLVKELFEEKNIAVAPILITKQISGSQIRADKAQHSDAWKALVPDSLHTIIDQIHV